MKGGLVMGLFGAADRHPFEFQPQETPEGQPRDSRPQGRIKEPRRHGVGRRMSGRETPYVRQGERVS